MKSNLHWREDEDERRKTKQCNISRCARPTGRLSANMFRQFNYKPFCSEFQCGHFPTLNCFIYLRKEQNEKFHFASADRITIGHLFVRHQCECELCVFACARMSISCVICPQHFFLSSSIRTYNNNKLKYMRLTNCFNGVVERCKRVREGHDLIDINHFHINCQQLIFGFFLLFRVCARERAVLNDLFGIARVVQINNGFYFCVLCTFTFILRESKTQQAPFEDVYCIKMSTK